MHVGTVTRVEGGCVWVDIMSLHGGAPWVVIESLSDLTKEDRHD